MIVPIFSRSLPYTSEITVLPSYLHTALPPSQTPLPHSVKVVVALDYMSLHTRPIRTHCPGSYLRTLHLHLYV